ncbi:uncharacterized protein LOC127010868 isoform X2 [Drosophila biarmipes]|uniref:uncharacterized protein LOC127010868 isoform X2 n=1 Tax=Drosophila biarmipes TaxID=125945 RepID=UPI0021CC783A|nr:uncharacterized protein LOC127010868 isoform X2 [Drosophila biarmipes]
MQLGKIMLIISLFCYVVTRGLSTDCRTIEEHCSRCLLKLNDSYNQLEVVNNGCRHKLIENYIWEDQDLCDMLVIACEPGKKKKDCSTIARVKQMRSVKEL